MTRGGLRLASALDLGLRERRSLGFASNERNVLEIGTGAKAHRGLVCGTTKVVP
jgi:hypothetical protein